MSDHTHITKIIEKEIVKSIVEIKLSDMCAVKKINNKDYFVDMNSPKYVRFVQSLKNNPIASEGKVIRDSIDDGANAKFTAFVEDKDTGKMITMRKV